MWWALVLGIVFGILFLLRKQFKALGFWVGYNVYIRRPGYYIHQKLLKQERMAHSQLKQKKINERITILAIPILSDNYSYMIIDTATNEAVLVDPSHAEAVLDVIDEFNVQISGILTTHYHWDHAGGNKLLLDTLTCRQGRYKDLPVIGSDKIPSNSIASISQRVTDQEFFQLGNFIFQALYTPGHTHTDMIFVLYHTLVGGERENITQIAARTNSWSFFTGDVLFSAGCGKFFEGTPEVMHNSLQRITNFHSIGASAGFPKTSCDENTLIWPGHEYTLTNLRFVYSIDERLAIRSALECAQTQRSALQATIPSTLAKELQINPFLRPEDPTYSSMISNEILDTISPEELAVATLAHLRKLKDNFQG